MTGTLCHTNGGGNRKWPILTYADVVDMCEFARLLKTQDAASLLAERRKWLELIAKLTCQF
jgi:hypothetical protein